MRQLGSNFFSRYKTPQDFMREEQEFEFRKRQREMEERIGGLKEQALQQQLNAPEPFNLNEVTQRAAMKYNMGEALSPEEEAAVRTSIMMNPSKQRFQPDEYGNVKAVTERNPLEAIFSMQPREAMAMPTRPPTPLTQPIQTAGAGGFSPEPIDPLLANQAAAEARAQELNMPNLPNTTMQGSEPVQDLGVDPRAMTAPKVQMDLAKRMGEKTIDSIFANQELDAAAKKKQQQFDMKLEELITQYGNLIEKGDFKTELPKNATFSDYASNLLASAQASEVGRGLGGALGTSTATAIEGVQNAQPMVFGELRELLGMTGREMDTDRERQFYMNIISDPKTEMSTTLKTLKTLGQRFGSGRTSALADQLLQQVENKKSVRKKTMSQKVQRLRELRAKAGMRVD